MDFGVLFISIAGGVLLGWFFLTSLRRFASASFYSIADPTRSPGTRRKLRPEGDFVVVVDKAEIRCTRPDGTIEKVTWPDLQTVEILATQDGPHHADTFWILNGASGGCLIPWGATGHDLLFGHLQSLPGFNNGPILQLERDRAELRTTCWTKPSAS